MKVNGWMRIALPACGLFISAALIAKATGNGNGPNGNAYGIDFTPTNVPSANQKIPGVAAPNVLSPELIQTVLAQGSWKLENPDATVASFYGYNNDLLVLDANGTAPRMTPAPGDIPNSTSPTHKVEATKTEPDK